jgi:DUF4097 and DUF4098 domain-containing protein YvlB
MRKAVLIGLTITLLVVCGLCALTTYGSYAWVRANQNQFHILYSANVSAETEEEREFEVQTSASLEVYTDSGDIQVESTSSDRIQVKAIKKAWASDEDTAFANANNLSVEYEQAGQTLRITHKASPEIGIITSRGGPDSVSFVISLPQNSSVKLTSALGDIALSGINGSAELVSHFGNVDVTQVEGSLSVNNSNSGIVVHDVNAEEGEIELETFFGDIFVENLSAPVISIKNSNGRIDANRLVADTSLTFESAFGEISIRDLATGSLKITNENGDIEVLDGTVQDSLEIGSSFGDVSVMGSDATGYTLHTDNGKITLDGAEGLLTLDNQFGDIVIENANTATLDLRTNNGMISFRGSLDGSVDHLIENSFGDISLSIPSDSNLSFDLKTEFGEIQSELPLTLTGSIQESSLQGTLNGGGTSVTATTSNGDIILLPLQPGE